MRLARQLVALRFFLADRQQPDARRLDAERHARVHAAHHRELQQMLRPALDAGADVEQHRRTAARRNRGRERRTIDARQHAERGVRRHHRCAGVAGAEERRGLAASRPGPAATLIDAVGLRRSAAVGASCHRDHVVRVDDANARAIESVVRAPAPPRSAIGSRPAPRRDRSGASPRAPRRRFARGAASPPIASTAIQIIQVLRAGCLRALVLRAGCAVPSACVRSGSQCPCTLARRTEAQRTTGLYSSSTARACRPR